MKKCIVINKEIVKKTKCPFNFACLTNTNKIQCNVESIINNSILFVKPTNGSICHYNINYGNGHICNCPVRKEICRKYSL